MIGRGKIRVLSLLVALVFFATQQPVLFAAVADDKAQKADEIAKKVEQEKILKEQEEIVIAKQHYEAGKDAFAKKDYVKAKSEFETALSRDPKLEKAQAYLDRIAGMEKKEKQEALDAQVKQGITEYKNKNYDQSIAIFDGVLAVDPENAKAASYKEKALSAKQKASETVKDDGVVTADKLLKEGVALYKAGNYDAATAKFQQVIEINPSNVPARRYMNEVLERQRELAARDNNILDQERMLDVRDAWMPPKKETIAAGEDKAKSKDVKVKTEQQLLMEEKAKQIIPEINFTDAHLRDVIKYLSKISGVNIILDEDLFAAAQPVAPVVVEAPAQETEGAAAPSDQAAAQGGAGSAVGEVVTAQAPAVPTLSDKITISLTNIPLIEALKYILTAKGLKYRIDEYAILVSTPERLQDIEMETRYYHLASGTGQFTVFEAQQAGEDTMKSGLTDKGKSLGTELEAKKVVTIKDVLEQSGVPWPDGSKIFLDQRTGTLIVRNTPSNLAVIEDILRTLDVTPFQISIEAKFVEIMEGKNKELGFNVITGEYNTRNHKTNAARGRTSMFDRDGNPIVDGDEDTGVLNLPSSALTSGNRSIMDARDTLTGMIAGTSNQFARAANMNVAEPTMTYNPLFDAPFTIAGVLTDPEFQVVIRALDQSGFTNMLSAPKVTTVNNQQAQIKVVTELIYPSEFEITPPTVTDGAVQTPGIVTPSEFVTRDLGIILDVTPSAGADRKTIHLTVVPEVSELIGWMDYGTPEGPTSNAIPVLQPVIDSQKVSTSVVINDGETVVLGGLMKDDMRTIRDKTPIFGDIPLIGRLFRTDGESREKSNLIIFITANLLTPSGEDLRKQAVAAGPAA